MQLRDQLALMLRGEHKEIHHNNTLIMVTFNKQGIFNIVVKDPENFETITRYSNSSLKSVLEFLDRF